MSVGELMGQTVSLNRWQFSLLMITIIAGLFLNIAALRQVWKYNVQVAEALRVERENQFNQLSSQVRIVQQLVEPGILPIAKTKMDDVQTRLKVIEERLTSLDNKTTKSHD